MSAHGPDLEKICAYCGSYTFKTRPEPGWAYCRRWTRWFPDPFKWAQEPGSGSKPPGLRTCGKWHLPKGK